jgi:hypothetical protein
MTYATSVLPGSSGVTTGLSLRIAFAVFGVLLAIQAMWILIPESLRPTSYPDPGNVTASTAGANGERAYQAAAIAKIRGDLWAESAFAIVGRNWNNRSLAAVAGKSDEKIRSAIIQTLRFSPHRGDVWLLFAAMIQQQRSPGYQPDALLKMSYYTAPNELKLLPLRLELILKGGIHDDELKELLRRDIQIIVMHDRALMPALIHAYQSAPAEGRAFLERVIMQINPDMIDTVRAMPR